MPACAHVIDRTSLLSARTRLDSPRAVVSSPGPLRFLKISSARYQILFIIVIIKMIVLFVIFIIVYICFESFVRFIAFSIFVKASLYFHRKKNRAKFSCY